MYYCCGYKDHSRPPVVSFHIYVDAMLPFGNQRYHTYPKSLCKCKPKCLHNWMK